MIAELAERGRIAYRWQGEAPAEVVALLRPLGGSMHLWGQFADALARRWRVLAFDPRGVGESSGAPARASTRGMARDVAALFDALGVARAHVFGLSLGGMVASWLAIDAPERVDKLVLASTLPRAKKISRAAVGEGLGLLRWFLQPGVAREAGLVRQVLSPAFRRAHPDEVRRIEAIVRAHPTPPGTLRKLAWAALRHDAEPRLREIQARTLLIVGGHDPLVGGRSQAELLLGIPDARLEALPDAGHDLSLERPVELAERVTAFLEAAPGQDPAHALDFFTRR